MKLCKAFPQHRSTHPWKLVFFLKKNELKKIFLLALNNEIVALDLSSHQNVSNAMSHHVNHVGYVEDPWQVPKLTYSATSPKVRISYEIRPCVLSNAILAELNLFKNLRIIRKEFRSTEPLFDMWSVTSKNWYIYVDVEIPDIPFRFRIFVLCRFSLEPSTRLSLLKT